MGQSSNIFEQLIRLKEIEDKKLEVAKDVLRKQLYKKYNITSTWDPTIFYSFDNFIWDDSQVRTCKGDAFFAELDAGFVNDIPWVDRPRSPTPRENYKRTKKTYFFN